MAEQNVAIVHDYLTQRGGAERVVLAMLAAFPGAPVYTSLFEATGTYPTLAGADIRTSVLNRVGPLRRNHRLALPLLAPAFQAMRVEAEVVFCSSTGWAHGARVEGRKIVYCHSPARWLYQLDAYLGDDGSKLTRTTARLLGPPLRAWDRRAASSADRYLANSTVVRDRIKHAYGIEAEVVPPPFAIDPGGPVRPVAGVAPGYVLTVSRLLPYKNVDAVVEAFRALPDERLVVVGTGPDEARLRAKAGANVTLLGTVADDELRWLYRHSAALVAASYEDFGLTPLEAAAAGKPAAVLAWGGFLDTLDPGVTGLYFEEPQPSDIAGAVRRVLAEPWDAAAIPRPRRLLLGVELHGSATSDRR